MTTEYASANNTADVETLQKVGNAAEVANDTRTFTKERVAELQEGVDEGNMSLRLLSSIGALMLIVVTFLTSFADLLMINGGSFLFGVYGFILGFVILILEYGKRVPAFGAMEEKMYANMRCLKTVWGRGCLLFFAGTVEFAQNDFINYAVGIYLCSVGVLFILVGRSAARKTATARRNLYTGAQFQKMFAGVDADGGGFITKNQFGELTHELDMDLTRREVEIAFRQIDVQNENRIDFNAFMRWWNDEATEKLDSFVPPLDMA
ncbi:MAG: hypothetical protein SGBAC_007082 [Bacillariaceae sp.]